MTGVRRLQQSLSLDSRKGGPHEPHFGWVLGAVSLFLLFAVIACDVLDRKPNTSVPNADNLNDLLYACQERREKIDDWVEGEERKLEDKVVDGGTTVLGVMVKLDRIEQDAKEMKGELSDNCQAKIRELDLHDSDSKDSESGEPFPTVTPLR